MGFFSKAGAKVQQNFGLCKKKRKKTCIYAKKAVNLQPIKNITNDFGYTNSAS